MANQFVLLLWKNWLVQKRSLCASIIEIGLALGIILLFFGIATAFSSRHEGDMMGSVTRIDTATRISGSASDFLDASRLQFSKIYYSPNKEMENKLMIEVSRRLNFSHHTGFKNGSLMLDALHEYFGNCNDSAIDQTCSSLIGGVVLDVDFDNNHFAYTIRLPNTDRSRPDELWNTERFYKVIDDFSPRLTSSYVSSGFLTLQLAIDDSIKCLYDLAECNNPSGVDVEAFHIGPQESSSAPPILFNMSLSLAFLVIFVFLIRNILREKETGLKEFMKVMGLNSWFQFLVHFIWAFIKLVLISLISLLPAKVSLHNNAAFQHSNTSLFLIFMLILSLALICNAFLISAIFQKASLAMIAGAVIYLILSVVTLILKNTVGSWPLSANIASLLVFNFAFTDGFQLFSLFESSGVGMQWKYIATPYNVDENLTLLLVMAMLFAQILICIIITWYLENVNPGGEGARRKLWFVFQPSYWLGSESAKGVNMTRKQATADAVENVPLNTSASIVIDGLFKVFKESKTVALNGLDLSIYPNQITVLLGHNGAGKTTLMKILTGLLSYNSGNVSVNGYNLKKSLNLVRHQMGLCPQHNILFDMLTVEEHIKLFCKLKGREYNQDEVDALLVALNLNGKDKAKKLSGGMKRKLHLAIAFVGGSELILLDEPTSGVDPAARRSLWDYLNNNKAGRTIILSTHYMEEADVLGDTIAIIAKGQLQCAGSPMFLKKHYGMGVAFKKDSEKKAENANNLLRFVQSHCSGAKLISALGRQSTLMLPNNDRSKFGTFFSDLEAKTDELNISHFGVAITTMEDVFLKVGEIADAAEQDEMGSYKPKDEKQLDINDFGSLPVNQNKTQQLKGLLIKRFILCMRHWPLLIPQFLIPLLCGVIFAVLVITKGEHSAGPTEDMPPLELNLHKFRDVHVPFLSKNADPLMVQSYKNILTQSNLQEVAVSQNTMDDYIKAKEDNMFELTRHYVVGASLNGSLWTAFYMSSVSHTEAISLNLIDSASLSSALGTNVRIKATNHPLPADFLKKAQEDGTDATVSGDTGDRGMGISLIILVIGLAIGWTSFVILLTMERAVGAKHMQMLTGLHPILYWLSNLICDFCIVVVASGAIVAALGIIGADSCVRDGRWAVMLMYLVLFGLAALPRVYIFSLFFKSHVTAYVVPFLLDIVLGTNLIASIIEMAVSKAPCGIKDAFEAIVFTAFPLSGFYDFLITLDKYAILVDCKGIHCPTQDSCASSDLVLFSWKKPGVARYFIYFGLAILVYWVLLFVLELFCRFGCRWILRRNAMPEPCEQAEDTDVTSERARINRRDIGSPLSAVLFIKDLTKTFTTKTAVNELSFHVPEQDCFGLLGVNGAGKTTTFEMLVGKQSLTSGQTEISGFSVPRQWRKAGSTLGYCPQFDALLEKLTASETLSLYARLRGVPASQVKSAVNKVVKAVKIDKLTDKITKGYSGGNKRRLSLAMALVGAPKLLLLDEPTSGVDPIARRAVWKLLTKMREHGIAVVLSSHSMEECEALCTRIAVMVSGRLVCIGSSQHLKSKFGAGYCLVIKLKDTSNVVTVKQTMVQSFPGSALKEEHDITLEYELPVSEGITWSLMFTKLESLIEPLNIVDYSLSQTTLEQVFLKLNKPPPEQATV